VRRNQKSKIIDETWSDELNKRNFDKKVGDSSKWVVQLFLYHPQFSTN
tara:strand:- start:57 stop:200 length:144 start_codon:yes stop_codon:yes gene_type:complete